MKLPLLACALVLALQSTGGDCASCIPGKRRAQLCEPHASEEQALLEASVASLRADDPETRIVALRGLAALTKVHTNAPSPSLVKTLARGLKDKSHAVRLETVKLLGGQHPEAALTALVPFVKAHVKRVEKAGRRQGDLWLDRRFRGLTNDREDWSNRDRIRDEKDAAEAEAVGEEQAALEQITDALAVDLAQYRDRRSVSALEALVEHGLTLELVNALATLGNVEAAELLVSQLPLEVKIWVELRHALESDLDETDMDRLKESAEAWKQSVKRTHTGLERLARSAGRDEDLPAMGLDVDIRWQAWLKRHRKSLPPKFRLMAMPWDPQ